MFQGNFKEVLREFEKSFHGVSIISDEPVEGLSKMFQRYLKGISKKLIKFHECFETVSRNFKAYQKSFKKGLFVFVVVATSRPEGGLAKLGSQKY